MSEDGRLRFTTFLKVGLPYTIIGMMVVLGGIAVVKWVWAESEYLTVVLFLWLALFWFIYQPLFRRQILKFKQKSDSKR